MKLHWTINWNLSVLAVLLAGCAADPQVSAIDESKVVDLTYDFDDSTVYWPTGKHFEWEQTKAEVTEGGYWYSSATYGASEHGGTHLDSPIHFAEGKLSTEQIPVSRLMGPAVVIDISEACAANSDYELQPDDLARWEQAHGRIPVKSIVLIRTGWGRFWPDKKAYLGSDVPGDASNLHFPGIGEPAAKVLVERGVDGVGIDTASLDHGPSQSFGAHQVLNGADIFGLENVAHLEQLPATGATVIALPMKIKGGTGGPARIIAFLP